MHENCDTIREVIAIKAEVVIIRKIRKVNEAAKGCEKQHEEWECENKDVIKVAL